MKLNFPKVNYPFDKLNLMEDELIFDYIIKDKNLTVLVHEIQITNNDIVFVLLRNMHFCFIESSK